MASIRLPRFTLAFTLASTFAACVAGSLAGCGPTVQAGLANAPWLGGDTPETRVHDVIANGRDACERSSFPQGDVLRGHFPPCSSEKARAIRRDFFSQGVQPPSSPWLPPWYPTGVCPKRGRGFQASETTLALSSPTSPERLACDVLP